MLRDSSVRGRFYAKRLYRLLVSAVLSVGLFGCTTITIPMNPIGTTPSVSLIVEADQGSKQAPLDAPSCNLSFGEFENPVVVIATGRDSDEAVRRVRLNGEVVFFCGSGDCIASLTDQIDEEIVDNAVPGEQGRISRNVLRLISFGALNDMCFAQSGCGQLDARTVNLHVRGEVENFHGQTSVTPLRQCRLDFTGIPPQP